ncbi:MAG: diiron oxygenase [Acidimicrobiales bacterium]
MTAPAIGPDATARISRLNSASVRRVIEPDVDVQGDFTQDQVVPDELLSIADLGLDLTPEQRARLSREELASILRVGIEFETVLMSGFAYQLVNTEDITDPRVTYALHEIGEETRHSRLFIRAYEQLHPSQRWLDNHPLVRLLRSRIIVVLMRRPATFDAFVLGGEEIPDLLQKLSAEHPDTDPYVRAINRYHRQEEARHLAFARTTVGEHHRAATWSDRFLLAHVVPHGIAGMFDFMVQPFVYETVGLPNWSTWRRVARSPRRLELRRQALRSVLAALVDAGVFRPGRVPRAWRRVCGVDRTGQPA